MKIIPKFKKNKTVLLSPFFLAACGSDGKESKSTPTLEFNTSYEPTVVILDYFQAGSTTHGPLVLQNFYGSFGNDHKDVIVIAEDVDHNKSNPLLRAYQDFQPDVINVSWGTNVNITYPAIFYYDSLDEKSIEKENIDILLELWEHGTTVTAAAGNYGLEGTVGPWGYSIFPIVVGAYLQFDSNNIAEWSNIGGAVVHYYEMGDGWGHEGTSFSAPRVAGHVALIKHDNPGISESSVRTLLEKNSIYEIHNNDYIQKLDNITIMNPEIDVRVRVEAMFEIFEGRNPSQEELDYWTELITNQELALGEMALQYSINGIQFDDVPPIERMQAFYHFWLGRESEDKEIIKMLEDLGITKDWNKTFDNFIKEENISTNYSFVSNNYNELLSFNEVSIV